MSSRYLPVDTIPCGCTKYWNEIKYICTTWFEFSVLYVSNKLY